MYLIAGQSNACGYTPYAGKKTETFENVWYAGMTDKQLVSDKLQTGYTNIIDFDTYFRSVQAGCGTNYNCIGPEYGMAKILNEQYNNATKAFIFKTGAGGTSLKDTASVYGNWYPRSLWEYGYTPNITTPSVDNDPTGILYQLFVENFRTVYNTLKENGYHPVVKGMAWMQGEADLSFQGLAGYRQVLEAFITDIRADLVEITGDSTLKKMPFVIGKISPSFGYWNNNQVPGMSAAQDMVAENLESVATVSVDDLYIVKSDGTNKGPDPYHYCFEDMVTLGTRFGETLWTMRKKNFLFF